MSILLHEEIKTAHENNKIVIEPYNEKQLGPNSYDVRIGSTLKVYDITNLEYLDCKTPNKTREIVMTDDGYILEPGILYLGTTIEKIGSDWFIPMYEGRSSMARLGIQSHLSAGFGDLGFKSNWTLEISVIHKTKIYPGMRIGQIYFNRVNRTNWGLYLYQGKYAQQTDAQESKSYLDFDQSNEKYNEKDDGKDFIEGYKKLHLCSLSAKTDGDKSWCLICGKVLGQTANQEKNKCTTFDNRGECFCENDCNYYK